MIVKKSNFGHNNNKTSVLLTINYGSNTINVIRR